MEVRAPLIADGQPPVPVKPREGAFNHPAMATQSVVGVDPLARDVHLDVATAQEAAAAGDVVRFVGMDLGGATPTSMPSCANRGNRVEQRFEQDTVMAMRAAQAGDEGQPMALDCEVVCRPRFPSIRGVRPGLHAPLFVAMLALSTLTRSQSIRSASPSRSSTTRCKRSQMPACCQSRSRRQQVTPDPQPISWGSNPQRRPALRTKIMSVKQARSGIRGRPPFGFGGSGEAVARRWSRAHPGRGGCSSVTSCPSPVPVLKGALRCASTPSRAVRGRGRSRSPPSAHATDGSAQDLGEFRAGALGATRTVDKITGVHGAARSNVIALDGTSRFYRVSTLRRIVDRTVSWLTPKSAARERRLLLSARERIADSSACESFRCRRA